MAWLQDEAWPHLQKSWEGDGQFVRPERDEHHLMLWGTQRPFDADFRLPGLSPERSPDFATLAEAIWRPFAHEKESAK